MWSLLLLFSAVATVFFFMGVAYWAASTDDPPWSKD